MRKVGMDLNFTSHDTFFSLNYKLGFSEHFKGAVEVGRQVSGEIDAAIFTTAKRTADFKMTKVEIDMVGGIGCSWSSEGCGAEDSDRVPGDCHTTGSGERVLISVGGV